MFAPLPQLFGSRVDLIAEATHAGDETRAVVSLRLLFDAHRYTVSSEQGYAAGFGNRRSSQTGMTSRVDAFWNDDDLIQGNLRAGGGVAREFGNDFVRGQADYSGPNGRVLGQVEHRLGNDSNTVYGANALVNVVGNGDEKEALGALIGRKGERLSALQHLVNLMLSKQVGTWTRVLVDVEDYRGRRERQLRDLANRAATRVVETGKMLQLEPMPALERRWVHLTLRDHPNVATQSIGEEPNRRVVLVPRDRG